MIRGTTPTFTLSLQDQTVDLTQALNVYATFEQTRKNSCPPVFKITKTGDALEISEHSVDVYFTQEESLQFVPGTIQIQLNWTYSEGERACSNIISIAIGRNLEGGVLQ